MRVEVSIVNLEVKVKVKVKLDSELLISKLVAKLRKERKRARV